MQHQGIPLARGCQRSVAAVPIAGEGGDENSDGPRSIVLSTNKPFAEWSEVFPHAACTVTLIDRLLHRSEIRDIQWFALTHSDPCVCAAYNAAGGEEPAFNEGSWARRIKDRRAKETGVWLFVGWAETGTPAVH